jgi:hypothetical protein
MTQDPSKKFHPSKKKEAGWFPASKHLRTIQIRGSKLLVIGLIDIQLHPLTR